METKRKKITVYLHPDVYPQDKLTQSFVESLPSQRRGDFYRQAMICGAALSSVDPRLVDVLSGLFSQELCVEQVVKIIEQVTGYKSTSIDMEHLGRILAGKNHPLVETKTTDNPQKDVALQNLKKLKF